MTQIKITNAILQYPNLFKTRSFQDGKPNYNAKILLNKTDHKDTINEIRLALKTICDENKITFKPDSFKCFKNGADSGNDKLNDFYVLTAKANEGRAPKVLGRDLKPYAGEVSSGAIANTIIGFWAFNHANISKGIACNLKAVQITEEVNNDFVYEDDLVAEEVFEKLESPKKSSDKEEFNNLDDEIPF